MKFHILILIFLSLGLNSVALSADVDWHTQILMSRVGSCQSGNLHFRALRFTKIPLNSALNNLFLRVILFIRPNNTEAVRLTTQELLGCQTSTNGGEVCSYRPVSDAWFESSWEREGSGIRFGAVGLLNYNSFESKLELAFHPDFAIPEVQGKVFFGNMVSVNFSDLGINTQKICQEGLVQ